MEILKDKKLNMSRSELTKIGMKEYVKKGGNKIRKIIREGGLDKLKRLTSRERFVIEHRAGLNSKNKVYPMSEIARMMGVTKQSVDYFEKKAIKKIKKQIEDEEFLMW